MKSLTIMYQVVISSLMLQEWDALPFQHAYEIAYILVRAITVKLL